MENRTHPTQLSWLKEKTQNSPLTYAFDSQFMPATPPDDNSVKTTESTDKDSDTGQNSISRYPDRSRMADLSTSLRVMGEAMLKLELAELEMMKRREMARAETEMQQAKLENEMTQMMSQTQLQIASYVSLSSTSRKRKRTSINKSLSSSERDGTLLMSLLHCNLM